MEPYELFDGVRLHAIGGEQVLVCRVTYDPGRRVPRHSHPEAEQLMVILDGEIEITSNGETRVMRQGDVAFGRMLLEDPSGSVAGVFIHDVVRTSEAERAEQNRDQTSSDCPSRHHGERGEPHATG